MDVGSKESIIHLHLNVAMYITYVQYHHTKCKAAFILLAASMSFY
jgi:hypothetical protein